MDWTQVLTIVAFNIGLILWARSESRADYRHLEQKTLEMMAGIKSELQAIQQQVNAIQQEIKDFHGRLCAIEERRK